MLSFASNMDKEAKRKNDNNKQWGELDEVKKKKSVRFIALTVSIVFLFILAACSGGSGNGNTPKETASGNGGNGTASEAPKSDVKLTMWGFKVAFDPGFKAVAEEFKKKTGITVETQVTSPDDAYSQKIMAASAVSDLPDLYLYWNGPASGAFDGTAFEWSQELNADSDWKNGFFPAALNGQMVAQGHIDNWAKDEKASDWMKKRQVGEIYGLPVDVGTFYTVYGNAKLLKEAGVSTDAPATVEEWIERMKTVKDKTGKSGLVFSGNTDSVYENWMALLQNYMLNGEESFTKLMNREETLSDSKNIHMFKFIEDLTKEKLFPDGMVSLDIDNADQLFARGDAAYALGGTFTYANFSAMGMKGEDIISFRVPAFEGSVNPDATTVPFGLVQMVVNGKGPHVEEAVEFVKYLTSEEGMVIYANAAFDIPAVNIKDKSKLQPAIEAMLSSLSMEENWWSQNGAILDKYWSNSEWRLFHELKQKVLLGVITAEEAAKQFDETAAKEKASAK
jgi:raffinose/stachyose/melibiose transport system substrate-binding protein